MEFDSRSQCSDEGVELSEHADFFPGDIFFVEEILPPLLEAKIVYLLLPKNVPISRAARLQWLLDHLNTTVTIQGQVNTNSNHIEIISAVPREQNVTKCNKFLITYRTEVKFIAHTYRLVYCLDMSPSHSNVDIEKGEVLFDEILNCFKCSMEGLSRQFTIPGNSLAFQPTIYLTVIINTPFFITPAQQVILKGVQVNSSNLNEIIRCAEKYFHLLEGKIAEVSEIALDQIESKQAQYDGIVGNLFDLPESGKIISKIPMVTPDTNFVNMLRYSMLAVSLLPENSLCHILVITDGIVAMPDSNIMESLLFQLHYDAISVSFLKVGSSFHPHSSSGFVSYTDLLNFIAHSTLGTCLESFPRVKNEPLLAMNSYHEFFLLWSFQTSYKHYPNISDTSTWSSMNETFYSHKLPTLLSKRQTEDTTSASILLLLARRLREGFTVDSIFYGNGNLEIKLILHWKSDIYLHYKLMSQWPAVKNLTHFEVYTSAPYEFLHDLTCVFKKETKSVYRQTIIERFWMRLSQLTVDLGLAQHLTSFQTNKDWYTLPESVKSGIPVYTLNSSIMSNCTKLQLTPRDPSCLKFVNMWQPIGQMETNTWRKWFHAHKISVILKHDSPLPKHLHTANSSQRYQVVQCRQAVTALYGLLSEWASFVLIDNHTYLKLLFNGSEKPPVGFCIVRVSSKFPSAVLNIGFTTNTSGKKRQDVCDELKLELSNLSYLASPIKSKENVCCVLLQNPIEKILIRYERIPSNYTTVIFPDGTQPVRNIHNLSTPVTGSLFTTLSRYLYHKRWIWGATHHSNPRLSDLAISRILSTLTRMRLKEGFSFAHSSSGIITMVLELMMEPNISCVVQYVLFPPHCAWWSDEMHSGSEEESETFPDSEAEMQMVTEVWIEPQYGRVSQSNPRTSYMDQKHYYEIADMIYKVDLKCIHALLAMEHLSLMCQHKNTGNLNNAVLNQITVSRKKITRKTSKSSFSEAQRIPQSGSPLYPLISPRIEHIPFKFDPISILPMCQQTELLFSMFIEPKDRSSSESNVDKANRLLLDNILEHLGLLHNQELPITRDESERFTEQVLLRHKNKLPHMCPLSDLTVRDLANDGRKNTESQWRCFIKGVSVTHVILTFVPSTIEDVKFLTATESTNIQSINETLDIAERTSSRGSNFSDVPINSSTTVCLPIYVYDCPLAMLVNAYVNNIESSAASSDDVYEDHRFRFISFIHEDCVKLKYDDGTESSLEEKHESHEINSVKQHSKTLVFAHSKCFTLSLFVALHMGVYVHNSDVQAAMDQCEEYISEVDITDYLLNVCGHAKHSEENKIPINVLHQTTPCSELKSLHSLIKNKFFKMIGIGFKPVPTNTEFYFYKHLTNIQVEDVSHDSDDELSATTSAIVEFRSDKDKDVSIYSEGPHLFQRLESGISDIVKMSDVTPLFLHIMCTMRYNNGGFTNTSLRVLPTCLGELVQNLETKVDILEKPSLRISLNVLCLTLPPEVQNIITDYSVQGLRSTSFCSDSIQHSISTVSEPSFTSQLDPSNCLSDMQKKSVNLLCDEIKWLLQDEICTTLLDSEPVGTDTLCFVMRHVTEGSPDRTSCVLDRIDLNFVYSSLQSHEKFVQEFCKMKLPRGYTLCKNNDLYYVAKSDETHESRESGCFVHNEVTVPIKTHGTKTTNTHSQYPFPQNKLFERELNGNDNISQQSDISSDNESVLGTDGGYDEDISDDCEEYDWLLALNNKRPTLPNFWLIMKIENEVVTIYFHCRFLELPTVHVGVYLEVQRAVCEAVRDLCKKVNQLLLLQSLHETKTCDALLEPEDNWPNEAPISRNASYNRLKTEVAEISDDSDIMANSVTLSDTSLNFKPGYFSCPVVWETHFILHPRLKTGSGKSGISRGILALKNILDKLSVSNRNNMFVYRDTQSNVFYLRLHENVHSGYSKGIGMRSNEYDGAIVSRSPSIASLPLGQNKTALTQSDQSISSVMSTEILRPRVRSFGEKDVPHEDTLTLKVHGITDAGSDVQQDLVQVLQNRLDDAVLECLSVMLARNAMCPLTPEDVHFIQKPFWLPEYIIRLNVQDFVLQRLESFVQYLKENLLQFLNVPKYTDNRPQCHFKDYTDIEDNHLNCNENIFIYNQSQNPSSGSRGIACIALVIIYNKNNIPTVNSEKRFAKMFQTTDYNKYVTSEIILKTEDLPESYLEFRLWRQGRVHIENLSQKLRAAVSQATWDVIMEYYILRKPLCVENTSKHRLRTRTKIKLTTLDLDMSKEIEFNCVLDMNITRNVRPEIIQSCKRKIDAQFFPSCRKSHKRVVQPMLKAPRAITFENETAKDGTRGNMFEHGDDGILSEVYSKYLPSWLEFGCHLNTPAVKRHRITLVNRHLPFIVIRELIGMLDDCPKAFRAVPSHCVNSKSEDFYTPFVASNVVQKYIIVSRNFQQWRANCSTEGSVDLPDSMSPQILKHSQKFVPTVSNNVFVPRQKIFWISVESDNIVIYTYNWARDNIERLITNVSNLNHWLCVRSCFLNSVTSQKLGLFHNQPLTRKCFMISTNTYSHLIGNLECTSKFPRDHSHKRTQQSNFNLPSVLEAFRDSYFVSKYTSSDSIVVFTIEMREMKYQEKKSREEMKKLHSMYQSRTSTTTVPQIKLLMQNSRIVHYCHTPILFLSRWKLKSAATRDHSLYPSHAVQMADRLADEAKEKWHTELCYGFLTEYRYYLQTLGFMPLQIDNPEGGVGTWTKDKSSYNRVFYIQKTILGGILIFTVEFSEPFFVTKLHAIECNRLQNISSRASINRFTLSFLDECDRVKILMHLHSFTYDYHLRCIYNYISGVPGTNKVCERYNIHQFLDDFLKYYNKAPNFARNLVHADTLTIGDLVTEGQQLYDYLLSNVSQYGFKVFEMEGCEGESEYILVQVTSTPQVSYRDSQDRQHTDDFDVTLVVYNLCAPYNPSDNILHLKYYLILTSKREIYPKTEVENKLGKFRTVSSGKGIPPLERNSSDIEMSFRNTSTCDSDLVSSDEHYSANKSTEYLSGENAASTNTVPHIEIFQESVNYLGYYSSHEQLMQQIILDKANTFQKNVKDMVAKGMVHCRTNLLWNRLISPQDTNSLTYEEFIELKDLAKLEHLCNLHSNLRPLLNQPLSWYQGLAKLLLVKYSDQNRTFFSPDETIQYYVILHPRYFGAFMLLAIDLQTSRGELYAVYREPHKQEDELCLAYQKSLLDGFVNCICFYLWSGMICS